MSKLPKQPVPDSASPRGTVPGPEQLELDFARFQSATGTLDLTVDPGSETIWATQTQIGELYGAPVGTVSRHIAALYDEGELPADTTRRPAPGGGNDVFRPDDLYDLDVILSVGYRISAVKATAFRKWATRTLRAVILDGYIINEGRLREDREGTVVLALG